MKKFLLVIILLLVLAVGGWAGATFFFGSTTSSWLSAELEKLKQQSGTSGVVDFEQSEYKKGFLSSEATTTLRMSNIAMEDWKGLKLKHVIYHGPLAKTPDGFKFGSNYMVTTIDQENLPQEAKDVLEKGFGGQEPFTLTVNSGFGKSMQAEMAMPAFAYDFTEGDEKKGKVEFGGISGSLSSTKTQGGGEITIGNLKIDAEDEDFLLEMEPGSIKVDVRQMIDEKLAIDADAQYLFPKVTVTAEGQTFRVNDIAASYVISTKDNQNLDGGYELSVGEVKLPAGAEFDVVRPVFANGAKIGFSISGMEIAAVSDLIEAQQRMQQAQADSVGKGTSEMTPESIQKVQDEGVAYMKAACELIKKNFGLGMVLSLGDGAKKSEMTLNLKYTGEGKATDLTVVRELISAITGDLNLHLDKSLVPPEQAPMLQQPQVQGIILDKGTHYEAVIKLSNATLDLNGQPMPLLEQMGPMAEMPIPWDQIYQNGAMMQSQ
jgi:hypothetical protein